MTYRRIRPRLAAVASTLSPTLAVAIAAASPADAATAAGDKEWAAIGSNGPGGGDTGVAPASGGPSP